jgi:hypothetical protein
VEKNNSSQIDIALFVELIAQFRHVIVHKRGIVSCRDAFDERVMSNAKVKGKSQIESAKSAIDQFFLEKTLKVRESSGWGDVSYKKAYLPVYRNGFENLTNILMSYAYKLFELVAEEFDEESIER